MPTEIIKKINWPVKPDLTCHTVKGIPKVFSASFPLGTTFISAAKNLKLLLILDYLLKNMRNSEAGFTVNHLLRYPLLLERRGRKSPSLLYQNLSKNQTLLVLYFQHQEPSVAYPGGYSFIFQKLKATFLTGYGLALFCQESCLD